MVANERRRGDNSSFARNDVRVRFLCAGVELVYDRLEIGRQPIFERKARSRRRMREGKAIRMEELALKRALLRLDVVKTFSGQ